MLADSMEDISHTYNLGRYMFQILLTKALYNSLPFLQYNVNTYLHMNLQIWRASEGSRWRGVLKGAFKRLRPQIACVGVIKWTSGPAITKLLPRAGALKA